MGNLTNKIFKLLFVNTPSNIIKSKVFVTFAVMEFSSKLIEKAVNEIAQLPGIGKRSALRHGIAFIKTTQRANKFFVPGFIANARRDKIL